MNDRFKRILSSPKAINRLIGFALAGGYLAVLLATASDIGFARDEGFYFTASRSYQRWFDELFENPAKAFTRESIDRHWKYNHEHPALMKTLFGFSERIFHKKLGVMNPSTANRFPGMITGALTLYLIFIFGAEVFDRRAGLIAALFFGFMPRVFYHAHLACFDMPITMMWIAVFYCYYKSLSSRKWGIIAGAVFGLALCTKLNAFFLPFLVTAHYLAYFVYCKKKSLPRPMPWAVVFGAILAPIVFMAHWPWVWFDTLHRLGGYMGFHAGHPFYNTAWFNENIIGPPTPIALPSGMTLFTVPTVIILLFLFGAVLRLRHHLPAALKKKLPAALAPTAPKSTNGFDLLWFMAFVFPIALISMPFVPIFGGTKHWMPAYPFMTLIAGAAAARFIDIVVALVPKIPVKAVTVVTALVLLLPPLQQTITSHPFGLETYVPLIGGAPGAASLGMTRQFWGYTTRSVVPWMNEEFPDGARVEIHDTTVSSWRMYQEDGILHRNLKPVRLSQSNVAFLHHELHMVLVENWIWARYNTFAPEHVLTFQGVPILSIYVKPDKR